MHLTSIKKESVANPSPVPTDKAVTLQHFHHTFKGRSLNLRMISTAPSSGVVSGAPSIPSKRCCHLQAYGSLTYYRSSLWLQITTLRGCYNTSSNGINLITGVPTPSPTWRVVFKFSHFVFRIYSLLQELP